MALTAGSAVEAIPLAFRRMGRTLFQPFDLRKWFVLGFCAWLAQLCESGGPNFNFTVPGGGGGGSGPSGGGGGTGPSPGGGIGNWFEDHVVLIVFLAVLALLAIVALGLLVLWLSSRGKFMFLDGVVYNRGAVVEPWRRYRRLANSLFGFRLAFGLAVVAVLAVLVAACLGLAWVDILREAFGPAALLAIVIGGLGFFGIVAAASIVSALLDDFVVPVMYLRGRRVLEAWSVFYRELGRGHFWVFVLFYVMKFVLGLAVAVLALVAMCLTCCLAALPYIGTVILLPVLVFMRCYSLSFIEQHGPWWPVFAYDLAHSGPPASAADVGGEAGA